MLYWIVLNIYCRSTCEEILQYPLVDTELKIFQAYADNHNRPSFRMIYADQERTLNETNFPKDVKIVDIFWEDQMWWDTRTGVH